VILPCLNEVEYIDECLDSILAMDFPTGRFEVLVIDGMSDDGTRDILRQRASVDERVRMLDNPRRITPTALNIGVRAARGAVIVRMDAHVRYPPEYLAELVEALQSSGADNVGTVIRTLPANDTATARAIAIALSHPFGVGNSHFRIGSDRARWVDTVPFGCWRRDVFERIGMFDEELQRNQDDEFNHRLLRNGGRILMLSHIAPEYYARSSLSAMARMYYQYGLFKPLVRKKVGRLVTLRQLAPPGLVLAVIALAILAAIWVPAAVALVILLSVYGVWCTASLLVALVVLHFSYGVGFLEGVIRLLIRRSPGRAGSGSVQLSR
jgi:glycosyltransferase involved in cell wall biosynthesis